MAVRGFGYRVESPGCEVTAHIFDEYDGHLMVAVRLEVEGESEGSAHDYALFLLKGKYPGKTINVTAKELIA